MQPERQHRLLRTAAPTRLNPDFLFGSEFGGWYGKTAMLDDAELLRRYAESRSETAFAELVQRHVGLVYSAALRQLNGATHRAEDVTQSVFVDLARKAPELSRRSDIVGWLYTSTHYAATMLKRTEARRTAREKEALVMNEFETDGALEWDQVRVVLDDAMLELSETDRSALLLRFFQNLRFADVGQQLGVTEDAARMRIERSLEKLRRELKQRGVSSTSAALATALGSNVSLAAPAGLAAKVASIAITGAVATWVGSGAVITLWSFMTTTKSVATAAGVLALLALGTAGYEHIRNEELKSTATSLEAERDRVVAERNAARSQSATLEQRLEAMRRDVAVAKQAAVTSVASNAPGSRTATVARTPTNDVADALMRNPEYVGLLSKRNAAKLGTNYATFYRQANLSPAQVAQFEQLMAEQLNRGYDVASATWLQGFKAGDPAYAATMKQHTLDTTARLTEWIGNTMGTAGYDLLNEFNRTKPVRELVRTVAAETYDASAPLTAIQGEQLVQLMTQQSASFQKGSVASAEDLDWNTVLANAPAFLSPDQVTALARIRNQQEIAQQMAQLSQRVQREAAQPVN